MDHPTLTASKPDSPCTCGPRAERSRQIAKWTTAGGLLAALGVCAACCLLPFALLTAGIATAWAGTLEGLAPYKWGLIVLTIALLAYGFYVAYRKPRASCSAGAACQSCGSTRSLRIGVWSVTFVALAGVVFEYIEPHLK